MKTAYETLNDKLSAYNLLEVVRELGVDTGDLAFQIRKDIIILTSAYRFERLKELEIERGELLG